MIFHKAGQGSINSDYEGEIKMNELQIFNNTEFGQIRIIKDGDKFLFCANDVAKALGYRVPKDAVAAHCKGAVKRRYLTRGGEQETKFIPEGDVYRLIVRSKLPNAEKFESWVFDDILPTIVKTGSYSVKPVSKIELLKQYVEILEDHEKRMNNLEMISRVTNNRVGDCEKKMQMIYDLENVNTNNWRTHIRPLINEIAKYIPVLDNGERFSAAWNKGYRRLEQKFNINLELRKLNKQDRLRKAGATQKAIRKVNYLDIIGEDKQLIECYISILRNMIIEYKRIA